MADHYLVILISVHCTNAPLLVSLTTIRMLYADADSQPILDWERLRRGLDGHVLRSVKHG